MPWNVRGVNIQPLLEGIGFIIFGMLGCVSENLVRLFFQYFVGCLPRETHDLQRIFIALVMIIQIDSSLFLVISHQSATWLDDQHAGAQRCV